VSTPTPPAEGPTEVSLRPARQDERWLIIRRVLRERLDPTKLKWQRFVMAEAGDGTILGLAQMKDWGEGVQEFGSLVVEPEARGQGIGGKLLTHFVDEFPRPVYLFCGGHNVAYYLRFGFRRLKKESEVPGPLQRKWRTAQFISRLLKASVALMVIE
jgi:amino-acid N-acetyltransferase